MADCIAIFLWVKSEFLYPVQIQLNISYFWRINRYGAEIPGRIQELTLWLIVSN